MTDVIFAVATGIGVAVLLYITGAPSWAVGGGAVLSIFLALIYVEVLKR